MDRLILLTTSTKHDFQRNSQLISSKSEKCEKGEYSDYDSVFCPEHKSNTEAKIGTENAREGGLRTL